MYHTQDKYFVSVFKNIYDKQPKNIPYSKVYQAIKTSQYLKELCTQLRAIKSKEDQVTFKQKYLMAFTVSGTFNGGHRSSQLIKHSGLLQIDVDNLDTRITKSISDIRKILIQDPFTYSLFSSPSGKGIKIIVRIQNDLHLPTFLSLSKYYMDKYKLVIDVKCSDLGRLCFMSHDPYAIIKESARLYFPKSPDIIKVLKKPTLEPSNPNFKDVEELVKCIEEKKIDITGGYHNWLKIGFALASGLGELGRNYFHRISIFNHQYNPVQTDKQYTSCLRNLRAGITLRSLFYIAALYQIKINHLKW